MSYICLNFSIFLKRSKHPIGVIKLIFVSFILVFPDREILILFVAVVSCYLPNGKLKGSKLAFCNLEWLLL